MKTNAPVWWSRVTHLLSRATLLPRTQLSCSWTHSAVLCKSAARPAVGGGLGLLWLASELRLRDVMDGCVLCGGGAGGRGGGPCWADRWSPAERGRNLWVILHLNHSYKQKTQIKKKWKQQSKVCFADLKFRVAAEVWSGTLECKQHRPRAVH